MELLAADPSSVTVQAITERADLGVGSFYYHFTDKQQAIDEATRTAFLEVGGDFIASAVDTSNLIERFSLRVRMFIQAADTHPVAARILVQMFPEPWSTWEMTAAPPPPPGQQPVVTAAQELAQAVAAGTLHTARPDYAILMVASGAVALIAQKLADPTIGPEAGDDYTETALVLLGLDPVAAHDVAHRPMPR